MVEEIDKDSKKQNKKQKSQLEKVGGWGEEAGVLWNKEELA